MPVPAPTDVGVRQLELIAAVVAGRWLEIVHGDGATHATRDAIVVPAGSDLEAARRPVLAQAALIGAGSLDAAWTAGLRDGGTKVRAARRFIALEVPRALRERAAAFPPLADIADSLGEWPASTCVQESLRRATHREALPSPPPWFGSLAPTLPPLAPTGHDVRTRSEDDDHDDDDAATTMTIQNRGLDDVDRWLERFTVGANDSWWRRTIRRPKAGPTRGAANRGGPSGRSKVGGRTDGAAGFSWRRVRGVNGLVTVDPPDSSSRRGNRRSYPEFDVERMVLQPDRCVVRDRDVRLESVELAPKPVADPLLRRRLARVVLSPASTRGRRHGDELDVDAAIDARIRLVATGEHDDRIWLAPRLRRPDLAVFILLDVSGSAAVADSDTSTHDRQVELTEVIADALCSVGARVAVQGFRSHGRRNVEMIPIVAFGAPWDGQARARLYDCQPNGFTRIGAAIRRASDLIDRHAGATRRLMIIISDGVAYDSGYAGVYAEADTRQALSAAHARSIGTLCVTVAADTDAETLNRVFGAGSSIRARTEADLRAPLSAMIRAALLQAARGNPSRRTRSRRSPSPKDGP